MLFVFGSLAGIGTSKTCLDERTRSEIQGFVPSFASPSPALPRAGSQLAHWVLLVRNSRLERVALIALLCTRLKCYFNASFVHPDCWKRRLAARVPTGGSHGLPPAPTLREGALELGMEGGLVPGTGDGRGFGAR